VGVRDFADDRQAQTRPIGPASDEGLKQTLANVLRNPGSSVAHTEGDPVIAIVCFLVLSRYTEPEKDLLLLLRQLQIQLPAQPPPKIKARNNREVA
jgi:hypothetical protein